MEALIPYKISWKRETILLMATMKTVCTEVGCVDGVSSFIHQLVMPLKVINMHPSKHPFSVLVT